MSRISPPPISRRNPFSEIRREKTNRVCPRVGPERRVEASGHDNEVTCLCSLYLASKGGGFEGEAA